MKLLTFASFLILSINFIISEHLDSSSYEIPLNCVIDYPDAFNVYVNYANSRLDP